MSYRPIVRVAWHWALRENLGQLICLLADLTEDELEQVIESAQMLDTAAQDEWEARRAAEPTPAIGASTDA